MSENRRASAPGLTRSLARILAREVRQESRDQAASLLLDTLGCLLGALAGAEGRIIREHSRRAGQSPEERAFLWGALSHALELDDLHRASITHPACVVIPAALAAARDRSSSPRQLLDAIVRGYEACVRVGEAVGTAHYRIFHNTATCGPFGAAAACSSLLGLDDDGCVWALGNAGSVSGGFWQFNVEGAMTKPLHAGHAARTGVTAAYLAAGGLEGPEHILEGPKGFFAGLCDDPRPEAVLAPSLSWKIAETSLKPWSSCRHTHPAIDAALTLSREVDPDQIAGAVVRGYATIGALCDRPEPRTPAEARFSIQHCVAVALVRGDVDLDSFEMAAIQDPKVRAVRAGVRFEEDGAATLAYPGRWGTDVEVETRDRGTHRSRSTNAKGDPESPLAPWQVDAKAASLLRRGAGWDESAATAFAGAVRSLGRSEDAEDLAPLWAALDQIRESGIRPPARAGSEEPSPRCP